MLFYLFIILDGYSFEESVHTHQEDMDNNSSDVSVDDNVGFVKAIFLFIYHSLCMAM